MKKTQVIELIKTIRETMVSYIAIAVFVMLGIAIFIGISGGGNSMLKNVERVAEEGNIHDLELCFPYGMNDEDLQTLAQVEGVDAIEGSRLTYELIRVNDLSYYVVMHQLSETLDLPHQVKGELPQKDGEIAVDEKWAEKNGVQLGDEILVNTTYDSSRRILKSLLDYKGDLDAAIDVLANDAPAGRLKSRKYTVTAFLTSTLYLYDTFCTSPETGITLSTNMFVTEDAWSEETNLGYTSVFIRSEALRGYSFFDDEYKEKLDQLISRLKEPAQKIAQSRCAELSDHIDQILKQAADKLDDAEEELDQAHQDVLDGEQALTDGKKEIEDGRQAIEDGKKTLAEALQKLLDRKVQLAEGWTQLEAGKAFLSQRLSEYLNTGFKLNRALNTVNNLLGLGEELEGLLDDVKAMVRNGDSTEAMAAYLQAKNLSRYADQLAASAAILNEISFENETELNDQIQKLNTETQEAEDEFNRLLNKGLNALTVTDAVQALSVATKYKAALEETQEQIQKTIDARAAAFSSNNAQLQAGRKLIAEKEAELRSGEEMLQDGWNSYNSSVSELDESQKELEQAQKDCEQSENDLEQGKLDYASGIKDYEQGKADYEQLKDALTGFADYDVTFVASHVNTSLRTYYTVQLSALNIRFILATLFVLVGLLVCYTAVSRLVHDQIIRIGTKKALGLNQREITGFFLSYSLSAAVIGCLLGALLSRGVARIILEVMMPPIFPGEKILYMDFNITLVLWGIELVTILLTTSIACKRILSQRAVVLLAGPKPPDGKRRFFESWRIWERSSLLTKTIVNNCLNDRRRVWGTLVGICSCTTLMIMSLTLYNNVLNGYNTQVNDYYRYNVIIYFDVNTPDAEKEIQQKLDEAGCRNLSVQMSMVLLDTAQKDMCTTKVFVPSDMERYKEFFTLVPYTDSDIRPYEGVWGSSAYLNYNGGDATQTIHATDLTGADFYIPVDGFFINYSAFGEILMTKEDYEAAFEKEWQPNCFLVDLEDMKTAEVDQLLKSTNGYIFTYQYLNFSRKFFVLFKTLAYTIVGIALMLSVAMTFMVVLNLLTMFVAEKKREIIVLRINGYTVRQSKWYIFSDTILLTVISILLALVLGTIAGNMTVRSMETSVLFLYKGIDVTACIVGAVATAILVAIASSIALRQLEGLKLTDINK